MYGEPCDEFFQKIIVLTLFTDLLHFCFAGGSRIKTVKRYKKAKKDNAIQIPHEFQKRNQRRYIRG